MKVTFTGSDRSRFMSKIIHDGCCWRWTGKISKTNGYPHFWLNGKTTLAHRSALLLFGVELKTGHQVDHLCRNRWCVNPDHLEQVSPQVNTHRSLAPSGINHRKTHCKRGHRLSGDNLRISQSGDRQCRKCICLKTNAWAKRNRDRVNEWQRARRARNG